MGATQSTSVIVGIGGAGCNIVGGLDQATTAARCVVMNTDTQSLHLNTCPHKVALTNTRYADSPEWVEEMATRNAQPQIEDLLRGARIVILVAGLGGHCGTDCTPVVADIARDMGIPTIGLVTLPISFEGKKRLERAQGGIEELRAVADDVLIYRMDDLLSSASRRATVAEAFNAANEELRVVALHLAYHVEDPALVGRQQIRDSLVYAGFTRFPD